MLLRQRNVVLQSDLWGQLKELLLSIVDDPRPKPFDEVYLLLHFPIQSIIIYLERKERHWCKQDLYACFLGPQKNTLV